MTSINEMNVMHSSFNSPVEGKVHSDTRLSNIQSKRSQRSRDEKSHSKISLKGLVKVSQLRPSTVGFQKGSSTTMPHWSPSPRPDTHAGTRLTINNLALHRTSIGSAKKVHFKHDMHSISRASSSCGTSEDFEGKFSIIHL